MNNENLETINNLQNQINEIQKITLSMQGIINTYQKQIAVMQEAINKSQEQMMSVQKQIDKLKKGNKKNKKNQNELNLNPDKIQTTDSKKSKLGNITRNFLNTVKQSKLGNLFKGLKRSKNEKLVNAKADKDLDEIINVNPNQVQTTDSKKSKLGAVSRSKLDRVKRSKTAMELKIITAFDNVGINLLNVAQKTLNGAIAVKKFPSNQVKKFRENRETRKQEKEKVKQDLQKEHDSNIQTRKELVEALKEKRNELFGIKDKNQNEEMVSSGNRVMA